MHRRLLRVSVLLLSLVPLAHADDASKNAKIQELFALTHVDRSMGQMGNQMLAQMTGMIRQQTANADLNLKQKEIVQNFETKVSDLVHGQLAWDKIKPELTTLYAAAYTESDLDGIIAFYKSPVGQTMLSKLPELNAKSIQIGQGRVTTILPQLRQMSTDFAKQMTDAATKPATPSATPAPAATPKPAPKP